MTVVFSYRFFKTFCLEFFCEKYVYLAEIGELEETLLTGIKKILRTFWTRMDAFFVLSEPWKVKPEWLICTCGLVCGSF